MQLTPREEFLIGRLVRQDSKVYEEILNYAGGKVFSFLVFLFASQEDATQSLGPVFAKMLHHPLESTPLLLQLLRYAYLEGLRRKYLEGAAPSEQIFFQEKDPKVQARISLILKSMSRLAIEEKAILLMREQLFLAASEIAWITRLQEEEVRTILNQARLKWRQRMDQMIS